jgi:hypothetical protein
MSPQEEEVVKEVGAMVYLGSSSQFHRAEMSPNEHIFSWSGDGKDLRFGFSISEFGDRVFQLFRR